MRKLDWSRNYAMNYGPSVAKYSQDGVDFDAQGNEVGGTPEKKDGPPEDKDIHWRDLMKMYEKEFGAGSWKTLPDGNKQDAAREALRGKGYAV